MTKPTVLPVILHNIPEPLRREMRWVHWRYVERTKPNGESVWAKLPLDAATGRAANSTDDSTWSGYNGASGSFNPTRHDGLGFVFSGDGLMGIDLDDCVDPMTGELNTRAQALLDAVPDGYVEVSPSGTGIKMFVRAPSVESGFTSKLDKANPDPLGGVEVYVTGRYFTVTGQVLQPGDLDRDASVAVGLWMAAVQRELGSRASSTPALLRATGGGGGAVALDDDDLGARALELLRSPLEDWTVERVQNELLIHLDPSCGYHEWNSIGMALHHQGDGAAEWLDLWDAWSSLGDSYAEGYCAEKWASFSEQRASGEGPLTLRSVIKAAMQAKRRADVDKALAAVAGAPTIDALQHDVPKALADLDLGRIDRERVARAIQVRAKELGAGGLRIADARALAKPGSGGALFPDVSPEGKPLSTHANVEHVLRSMKAVVRYNVISKEDEILIPGAAWSMDNRANASLAAVLSESNRLGMNAGGAVIKQFISMLADQNQYNPALTWIESKEWDRRDRLGDLYATVRVAPDKEPLRNMLMFRWLIQCIAILHNTGDTQARGVLVFQGKQYMGKTRWLLSLAPSELRLVHTGMTLDLRNKDSCKTAVSFWLVELGELDATFRRSDIAQLKSFASQQADVLRKPYAMTDSSWPRRTAYFGSVNDDDFLADPSGNSRFWSLPVLDTIVAHGIDMQQLWAQVLLIWKGGEQHWLTPGELELLNASNTDFEAVDPMDEAVAQAFPWSAEPPGGWQWLTSTQVAERCGYERPTMGQLRAISRAVVKLNGGRKRRGSAGRRMLAVPIDDPFMA